MFSFVKACLTVGVYRLTQCDRLTWPVSVVLGYAAFSSPAGRADPIAGPDPRCCVLCTCVNTNQITTRQNLYTWDELLFIPERRHQIPVASCFTFTAFQACFSITRFHCGSCEVSSCMKSQKITSNRLCCILFSEITEKLIKMNFGFPFQQISPPKEGYFITLFSGDGFSGCRHF